MNGSFISQSTFRFKRSVCVCLYSFSLSFSSILFPFLSEIENKNGKIAQKSWNSIVYCTLSTLSCCTTIVKTYSSPNIFIGNSKWVAYALVFCVVFVPNYFSGACFFLLPDDLHFSCMSFWGIHFHVVAVFFCEMLSVSFSLRFSALFFWDVCFVWCAGYFLCIFKKKTNSFRSFLVQVQNDFCVRLYSYRNASGVHSI